VLWGGFGELPQELPSLSSDDRHVTIRYSIDYPTLLLKTQYRTRIDGQKWSAWDFDTEKEFPNLKYGSHIFEVQARDAFGKETEVLTVTIDVSIPIYFRWYMMIFYQIISGVIIYLVMRLRTYKLEKDKLQLEQLVQERTTQVVRLEKMATVGKLTQGLIDRILNPMNYINNFAKLSEGLVKDVEANLEDEKENISEDNYEDTIEVLGMLTSNLRKIGEHGANTTRTLKAMEEMLKDRSGGIVSIDLAALLRQNQEMAEGYYKQQIANHQVTINFHIPTHEIRVMGNAEQLSKTVMSLIANSMYATDKKWQREQYDAGIDVSAEENGNNVQIVITDNGIGIEDTIIDKIFDPFFTTKTTGEAAGVGLYLSREIIQNHGGDITVKSEKNSYTTFTITLNKEGYGTTD
jgi:signal transduction histidine kinase